MDSRIKIIKQGELGTRPSWDEYFMHAAIGIASRASCHNVHSGTVIASNNQIIATGYNGAPSKIKDNCLITGCRKKLKGLNYEETLGACACIGVHSEMNALGHLSKRGAKNIILYTTIFPCYVCAKNILAYDIKKIVFKKPYSDKELKPTLDLLEEADVEIFQLDISPERDKDIQFNKREAVFDVWSNEEKQI